MDELVDILDANGNFTGKTAMKSEAHRKGWFHPTIHVWFYTKNGKILIQQRAKNKDTHPLLWDVSVAGHIGAGESIENSALREIQEEIGLTVSPQMLEKIGKFKSEHTHHADLIDREYHHTFLCELEVPISQLQKQESEVEKLALISLLKFSEETWGMANLKKYVPHEPSYYKTIVKEIKKRL
ncbi:NUDIX hydrolase [Pareuzebyella sediminis]|uniref:NUDIX hydrolase n=1 Tax=Pareuzebyella sediminis TaxID=2607998 RepID=UPI0011ED6C65|nr:NUDIX domain-containing protein [Pareuzebyella sediminis]